MSQEIITIQGIIGKIKKYNPTSDSELIQRAYQLAASSHQGQKRDSGEDYITHPLAVANILADLQLDDVTVSAGLLHDVVEDTQITLEDLTTLFGEDIAVLVDGVTKLSRLEYRSRQERQAENLRKMFMAMSNDIRIIMIKLADRLHNMRTLKYHHSPLRQQEIAEETISIFAPLAHRLGIFKIKSELEDLSLRYLEPNAFNTLKRQMAMRKQERDEYINSIIDIIQDNLDAVDIKADISGRSKNFYSIYNKMIKQQKSLNEIFDLSAIRIIVDNIKDCYGVLGIIHTLWKPIPGRFKDYIAMPKQNMYQSIHTTVIGPSGDPFEVQIRTWEMHRIAEYGIAAHWRYKEGKSADADFDKKIEWIRHMLEWQNDLGDAREFMESVKVDLFTDSVYVFSPKGDVFELPKGACPIDFAYRVHTQVGHQCVGAKVNRRIVPLDYVLSNGDIVDVLTAKGSGPSRDWLKIAKTSQAKNKIRQWFKKEKRDEHLLQGKEILERECKKNGHDPAAILKPDKVLEAAKKLNYLTNDDLFVAVGEGAIAPLTFLTKIKEDFKKDKDISEEIKPFSGHAVDSKGICVKDIDNVMVRLSHCCNPLPGDKIIGYVTRGRGISVHRFDCPNMVYYTDNEPDRLIDVHWGEGISGSYQTEIEVVAMDRNHLTVDIVSLIADTKTHINGVQFKVNEKDKVATVDLKMEIKSLDHLEYIINKIRKVKDVIEVKRIVNGNSEN